MKEQINRPVVIYIIGAGSSGSTLLSMLLGANSNAISVGELHRLDEYITHEKKCTCGLEINKCKLWSEIINEKKNDYSMPFIPILPVGELIRKGRKAILNDVFFPLTVKKNIEAYEYILRKSNRQFIIDSSKDLSRLFYLQMSEKIKVVPVLITRDGRSYIDSKKKRGGRPINAIMRWVRLNLNCFIIARRLRLQRLGIQLNYESLLNNPEEIIQKICHKSGLVYEKEMINYGSAISHNIAGSPSRFNPESLSSYDKNIKRISVMDHIIFFLLGGYFWNRLFKTKNG